MSTEPDYNFNEPAASETAGASLTLPFALICAAVAVFLTAQTLNTFFNKSNLADNKQTMIKGKADLEVVRKDREKLVEQSKQLQAKLQEMVTELMTIAQTDKAAEEIVKKYNISLAPRPEGAAPAPAPAPATP